MSEEQSAIGSNYQKKGATHLCLIRNSRSRRKLNLARLNDCVFTKYSFLCLVMSERTFAKQHLIEQNTSRPDINLFPKTKSEM